MNKKLEDMQREMNKKLEFATGNYYAPLGSIWKWKRERFEGAAVIWENHRKKDTDALRAYQSDHQGGLANHPYRS